MLSIKGNLIVLLKLALNCKLWTESHLPSLKGNKAIDTRVYTVGTDRSLDVNNTRPKPQLTERNIMIDIHLTDLLLASILFTLWWNIWRKK